MNHLLATGPLLLLGGFLVSCAPADRFHVGGVPQWIAEGARISSEPEPYRPDTAILYHGTESGPVEFKLITDRRAYPEPKAAKKKEKGEERLKTTGSLGDRGREWRVRRLVR